MNYFAVNECGLYRNQDPKVYGCDLTETFSLIASWALGKTMADTLPWDPRTTKTGASKCYLNDIFTHSSTGDIVLVLWKSDTDNTGTLLGAQETGTVGSAPIVKYTDSYRGKKVIWGRPCYYWIVPEYETIISIKFDHSLCDSSMMQDWVSSCITLKVDHKDRLKETTETGHIRLAFASTEGGEVRRYRYGFDVTLKTLSTSNTELAALAASVTHIIRRETVTLNSQKDERATWVKLFDSVPYLAPKPKSNRRQIEVRAEAKPTVAELRQLIETYARQDRRRSDWENLGFGTETGVRWVDRYRIKNYIDIEHDVQAGALTAADLYRELSKQRAEYLAPLRKESLSRAAKRK